MQAGAEPSTLYEASPSAAAAPETPAAGRGEDPGQLPTAGAPATPAGAKDPARVEAQERLAAHLAAQRRPNRYGYLPIAQEWDIWWVGGWVVGWVMQKAGGWSGWKQANGADNAQGPRQ